MSFRSVAAAAGALRDPALTWPDEGPVLFILDAGESPERVALHDLGHARKKCEGEGCELCKVGVRLKVSWLAKVEVEAPGGVMSTRSLWLSKRDLGELAAILPESGTVWITSWREDDPSGNINPRTGQPWQVKRFALYTDATMEDATHGQLDA